MKIVSKSLAVIILGGTLSLSAMANPLYTKCIACHGPKGEKAALGKSHIIKDMSKAEFIAALKGYKNGSYGRKQKAMMKVQVAKLTDAQIQELADFIAKK